MQKHDCERSIYQFIIDVETRGWFRETMYYGRVFRTIQRSEIELVFHDLAHDHSAFLWSRAHTACPWLINLESSFVKTLDTFSYMLLECSSGFCCCWWACYNCLTDKPLLHSAFKVLLQTDTTSAIHFGVGTSSQRRANLCSFVLNGGNPWWSW